MKVVAFIGHHNSGKTSLLEQVARRLKEKGYRVGYIKHDPKGHGVTDREGSDTDRIFRILDRVILLSPDRLTLWDRREEDLFRVIEEFFSGYDIVLLEGFKGVGGLPKVALGDVEADNVIMRVSRETGPEPVVELIERLEGRQ
ncbi:MAG: molybdopterin-guanine dinucleotide biosynthesis protein B [Aquificota bacterium]|nr:molybdopterin-guanine dinucleotide biosynthesis protein B [Aquificota bacterium]